METKAILSDYDLSCKFRNIRCVSPVVLELYPKSGRSHDKCMADLFKEFLTKAQCMELQILADIVPVIDWLWAANQRDAD